MQRRSCRKRPKDIAHRRIEGEIEKLRHPIIFIHGASRLHCVEKMQEIAHGDDHGFWRARRPRREQQIGRCSWRYRRGRFERRYVDCMDIVRGEYRNSQTLADLRRWNSIGHDGGQARSLHHIDLPVQRQIDADGDMRGARHVRGKHTNVCLGRAMRENADTRVGNVEMAPDPCGESSCTARKLGV